MPSIVNGFEVYAAGELPAAKERTHRRGTRRKYPWYETERGGGFQFSQEVTEQSARVQASKMSGATGFEFKVYYDADGLLWCARVDKVPRTEWPDRGQPKAHRYLPVEPKAPGTIPPASVLIDDGDKNANYDDGAGTPAIFGKDDGEWQTRVGPPPVEPYVRQSHDDGDWGSPADDSLTGDKI